MAAVVLLACILWAAAAWMWPPTTAPWPVEHHHSLLWHRVVSVLLSTLLGIYLFVSVMFEQPD